MTKWIGQVLRHFLLELGIGLKAASQESVDPSANQPDRVGNPGAKQSPQ
jgi:hypothetical protein